MNGATCPLSLWICIWTLSLNGNLNATSNHKHLQFYSESNVTLAGFSDSHWINASPLCRDVDVFLGMCHCSGTLLCAVVKGAAGMRAGLFEGSLLKNEPWPNPWPSAYMLESQQRLAPVVTQVKTILCNELWRFVFKIQDLCGRDGKGFAPVSFKSYCYVLSYALILFGPDAK